MFGFFACCACTGGATANSAARRPATMAMDILFIGSPVIVAHTWYFRIGGRTGQRLGSSLPVGSANRQRSVPSRSNVI